MGKYLPNSFGKRPSIKDTLNEAEYVHLMDSSDAEPRDRLASEVLDLLFFAVYLFSIHRMGQAIFANSENLITITRLVDASGVFLFLVSYFGMLCSNGSSPAKVLFAIRVIDSRSGKAPTLIQALVREILGKGLGILTLGIGFGFVFMRSDRRALHDVISETQVKSLKAKEPDEQ
jgi:uncharacterized RDD family membrane protein YckC